MTQINWDKYILSARYEDVLDGMGIARKLMPSMFSKCKKYIYVRSLDSDCKIDDFKELNFLHEQVSSRFLETYSELKEKCSFDKIEDLYFLKIDYIILSGLLSENPEEEIVFHPEKILDKINYPESIAA